MAIRSSIQLGVGKDDDRWSPGFTKAAATVLFGGLAVTSDTTQPDGKLIKPFAGATAISKSNPLPLGLVFESSVMFPVTNTTNPDGQAGYGYDNLNYARGGMFSVFHRPGNAVDVYDDGRDANLVDRTTVAGTCNQPTSCPFIIEDSWAVGDTVYATVEGLLTNVDTSKTAEIGTIRAVSGTGASAILTLELAIVTV
jgi:hypothetical protein